MYTHTSKIILHSEPKGVTSEYIWVYLSVIGTAFLNGEGNMQFIVLSDGSPYWNDSITLIKYSLDTT